MNAIWQVGDLSSVLHPGSFAPLFTPVANLGLWPEAVVG
jgi:hypothetical protein